MGSQQARGSEQVERCLSSGPERALHLQCACLASVTTKLSPQNPLKNLGTGSGVFAYMSRVYKPSTQERDGSFRLTGWPASFLREPQVPEKRPCLTKIRCMASGEWHLRLSSVSEHTCTHARTHPPTQYLLQFRLERLDSGCYCFSIFEG